jgi:hypothetical protein
MVSEEAEKKMTKQELAEQVAILYGGRASTAQQMALLTIDEARRINSAEDGGAIYDRRLGGCPAGCGGQRPFPETHGENCPYVRAWEEAPTRVVLARPEAHIEWCNKNWREYWPLDTGDWAATIDGCRTPALVFEIEQMAGDVFYGKGSGGSWWTKRHLRPAWPKEIDMQKLIDCPDGGAVCVSQEYLKHLRKSEDPQPEIDPLKDRWVQLANKKWYCRACGAEEGNYHRDYCEYRPQVVGDGLEPKPRPKTETPSECAKRLKDQLYCKHCNAYLAQMHALSCPDHSYRYPFGVPIPIVAVEQCPCCSGKKEFPTGEHRAERNPQYLEGAKVVEVKKLCPECAGTGTQKVGPTVIARG